jgi:hypothetical protein
MKIRVKFLKFVQALVACAAGAVVERLISEVNKVTNFKKLR